MTAPLVFPVGHYLGSNHRDGNDELNSHVIRIGWRLNRLDRMDQFAVWALAHGLPEGADMTPWTLAATEGAARASGVRDARAILADLMAAGLVVDVESGTEDAVTFAQSCRVYALQSGLGDLTEQSAPGLFGIGQPNVGGVRVDAFTYELWKWGPSCDSVWHLCEIFARAEANDRPDDPFEVLARVLPTLQVLIAHGAAYLDESREEADLESTLADTSTLSD